MPPASRRSGNPATRAKATQSKNARPAKKTSFSLARYREEATGEPFPFEVDDGHVIEIPRPSGEKMMDLAEKYSGVNQENQPGNPREQLADLLGDAYDEVMPILEAEDFGVMLAFLKDIVEHFDLGEALASFT